MAHYLNLRTATRVIHGGQRPEANTGALMPPIFTSATYVQESPGQHKGFEYSRSHNPTRFSLERLAAALEGSRITEEQDPSCGGFAFASGMAAMSTILELVDAGDRVLVMDDLYGGSRRLLAQVRQRSQHLDVRFVDMSRLQEVAVAMTPETKMLWVETPTNPMMKIADLEMIATIAREMNPSVLLVCDNTFASPVNQRPLEFGFDITMHSTTKYLNGHSDVIGGVAVVGSLKLAERLRYLQNAIGSILGPFDAYLTLRGAKTLALRMERHNTNAQRVAEYLETHPMVQRVLFPGLPSHPQHELFKRQMDGPSGMISVFLNGDLEAAKRFLENLRLFSVAESLGGVESLANHPAIMTHASVPAAIRKELGIGDTLVRLSVGIEDCDDLIADLEQALAVAALV